MYRLVYADLLKWKESPRRMPLLVEGVRQCGKTHILREFGEREYADMVYFNFESDAKIHEVFERDLDPVRIIDHLGFLMSKKIIPGETLLVFDEIQACGRALASLKYFCEDAPEYHVACAGSLLGVLTSKPHSFPVGKVDRIRMRPMCFREFACACGEEGPVRHIEEAALDDASPAVISRLAELLRTYMVVGGMPRAVSVWLATRDIRAVEDAQKAILNDYRGDFARHAEKDLSKLTLIWDSIPSQLVKENRKFMFGHVRKGARAKDLEDSLQWLIDAGLAYKVPLVERPEIPLQMFADRGFFKIYMPDVGLFRCMAGAPPEFALLDSVASAYRGAAAECLALCELEAMGFQPCYWRFESIAEVDFMIQFGADAIPVEVKAGPGGRSKSLGEYIKKHSPKVAVKTSMSAEAGGDGILCVPLCALWNLERYLADALSGGSPESRHGDG